MNWPHCLARECSRWWLSYKRPEYQYMHHASKCQLQQISHHNIKVAKSIQFIKIMFLRYETPWICIHKCIQYTLNCFWTDSLWECLWSTSSKRTPYWKMVKVGWIIFYQDKEDWKWTQMESHNDFKWILLFLNVKKKIDRCSSSKFLSFSTSYEYHWKSGTVEMTIFAIDQAW